MTYPVLLSAVVLDSTNNTFRMTETTTVNLTIPAGTYYLRGDGSADDLLKAWETAMNGHGGGGNTYAVTSVWSVSPSAVASVRVATARTAGASTWGILWADAATTLDPAIFGSADANEAINSIDNNYALSPSCVWVSPEIYRELEPVDEFDGYVMRARSGVVRRGLRGGPYDVRRLGLSLVAKERTHSIFNTADPNACFNEFLSRWLTGRPAELHIATISSGTTLAALSSSTEHGAGWHVGEDGGDEFAARRLSPGTGLYSWDLTLWGHV